MSSHARSKRAATRGWLGLGGLEERQRTLPANTSTGSREAYQRMCDSESIAGKESWKLGQRRSDRIVLYVYFSAESFCHAARARADELFANCRYYYIILRYPLAFCSTPSVAREDNAVCK